MEAAKLHEAEMNGPAAKGRPLPSSFLTSSLVQCPGPDPQNRLTAHPRAHLELLSGPTLFQRPTLS